MQVVVLPDPWPEDSPIAENLLLTNHIQDFNRIVVQDHLTHSCKTVHNFGNVQGGPQKSTGDELIFHGPPWGYKIMPTALYTISINTL